MALLFESTFFSVIAIIVTLISVLCLYVTRKFNFWKNQGVPYVKPLPFFGSLKDVILQKEGIGSFLTKLYYRYEDEPYVGIFSYDQPAIVIRDLEIIKKVVVKEADNFMDHVMGMEEDLDPMGSRILFAMDGEKWKRLRTSLTPNFSSGKLKMMFNLLVKNSRDLVAHLDAEIEKGAPIEVKDSMSRFTIDVITSVGFGIDSNSLKNPNAEFTMQLRKIFAFSQIRCFASLVSFFAPHLMKIFRLNVFDSSLNPFMRETVWKSVEYREKNNIVRKDFLDYFMEIRKKGRLSSPTDKAPAVKLEGDDFVAQAFNFLAAGFETSSSTMSFTLYEIALQPDIQDRLRAEITDVLAKYNDEVTYEALQEMPYLDMAVAETLRKYPILPFLDRKCRYDYKLSAASGEGTLHIPAGTGFYIPLMAIHYDPEYYPDPNSYDPERFSDENKKSRPSCCYMPFGEGPRFCIGMRFGLMQVKTGLANIIFNFEVEPCKETPTTMVYDKKVFTLQTTHGLPLSFKKLRRT